MFVLIKNVNINKHISVDFDRFTGQEKSGDLISTNEKYIIRCHRMVFGNIIIKKNYDYLSLRI